MLRGMTTRQHTGELQECLSCGSALVHPVEWEPVDPGSWSVLLRCPNCEVHRLGVFEQEELDAFDAHLDHGDTLLREAYEALVRENMQDDVDRFAHALAAGAILPEDF
jgi:hypothetical protein